LESQPDVLCVELWALGPVYVPAAGASVGERLAAPAGDPQELVPLLSAAGALPPGIVPDDLRAAEISGGELVAELPAALLEWSAGGARAISPRVHGVPEAPTGHLRVSLDSPKLEVY
jgi:hypothetical protein